MHLLFRCFVLFCFWLHIKREKKKIGKERIVVLVLTNIKRERPWYSVRVKPLSVSVVLATTIINYYIIFISHFLYHRDYHYRRQYSPLFVLVRTSIAAAVAVIYVHYFRRFYFSFLFFFLLSVSVLTKPKVLFGLVWLL